MGEPAQAQPRGTTAHASVGRCAPQCCAVSGIMNDLGPSAGRNTGVGVPGWRGHHREHRALAAQPGCALAPGPHRGGTAVLGAQGGAQGLAQAVPIGCRTEGRGWGWAWLFCEGPERTQFGLHGPCGLHRSCDRTGRAAAGRNTGAGDVSVKLYFRDID